MIFEAVSFGTSEDIHTNLMGTTMADQEQY